MCVRARASESMELVRKRGGSGGGVGGNSIYEKMSIAIVYMDESTYHFVCMYVCALYTSKQES